MRRLTEAERWRAIGMLQTGSTQVQPANITNISQSVVSRLWARYQRSGAVADMQRSWRSRSTSRRDDRLVVNQALRNRSLTSTDLQQYLRRVRGVTVSRQTIRNRVHGGGLRARRAQVVLPFKPGIIDHVWHGVHSVDDAISISGRTLWSVMSQDLPWTFLTGVGESGVELVSVRLTLLELLMIGMEEGLLWHGMELHDRKNRLTCMSMSSYWCVLP